jgi:Ca2+/Na+ antiporter
MVKSIKVKDNSNLAFIVIPFCLFPLVFMGIASLIDFNYILTLIIMVILYTGYLILILKYLKQEEEVYAIAATEDGISFKDFGTFKWSEIKTIKAKTEYNLLIDKNRSKFLDISLLNGKNFRINATNFDYPNHELESIFKALGKLDD